MLLQDLKMNSKMFFIYCPIPQYFLLRYFYCKSHCPGEVQWGIHSLSPRLVGTMWCHLWLCLCVWFKPGLSAASYHCGEAGFKAGTRAWSSWPAGEQEIVWSESWTTWERTPLKIWTPDVLFFGQDHHRLCSLGPLCTQGHKGVAAAQTCTLSFSVVESSKLEKPWFTFS